MKKFLALTAMLVLLSATSAFAVITGSSHDFGGWAGGEICAPCHTPHNANASTVAPLWAHTTSSAANTFNTYVGFTPLDGSITQPAGISLACLSCHDGTTAMDSFIGTTTTGVTPMGAVAGNLGVDLTNDHPISITYVDGVGTGMNLRTGLDSRLRLFGAGFTVECATCHDVHNGSGLTSMLVMSNGSSLLCLNCHDK